MQHLSQELLNNFQELIYKQSSLWFSPYRLNNLEMQILERVKIRDLLSFEDYLQLLQEDFEEFDTLIEGITTKETYFFRLPDQFKALVRHVIPKLEEGLSKEAQRLIVEEGWSGPRKVPLRIWSAGCSTGEEPYSIAMTLMDSLKYPRAWKIEILATDISREAVNIASNGFYETNILKKVPILYQKKYMKRVNNGAVIMSDLSEKISFRIFNLCNLNPKKEGTSSFMQLDGGEENLNLFERFDMVFCRNVMIYFDFQAQQQLVDNLYACIKPGGYLFTGDAELIRIYKHCFETLEFEGAYFYQKPDFSY
jgi:chemotaxis protein methyltransferase CheR